MENNTTVVDAATGLITECYTEQVPEVELPIVIDYDAEVNKLVRQRYTASQEFAINRKFAYDRSNEAEFLEYYNYVENCKQQIQDLISNHS